MDCDTEVFNGAIVPEVTIEAIGLLDEDRPGGRSRLEKRQHLVEGRPTGFLRCFRFLELTNDCESLAAGVLVQQLALCRNREPLTFLVLR